MFKIISYENAFSQIINLIFFGLNSSNVFVNKKVLQKGSKKESTFNTQ